MTVTFIANLALVAIFALTTSAQSQMLPHEWSVTFNVVSEADQPIVDAQAWVGYMTTNKLTGLTDSNGVFVARHHDRSFGLALHVDKRGYYPHWERYELGFPAQYAVAKWNPTRKIVLKSVMKPIPMYAKRVNLGVPDFGKPIGFDLVVGDWVSPFGKGNHADLIFEANIDKRAENNWDSKLIVSFQNPGDGIQSFASNSFRLEEGSKLRSPHNAPEMGYQPYWVKTSSQRPGEASKYNVDDNLNFFIRIRTLLDEKGNVKTALYGKIYGDFMQFRYYLNPTPNDRNVEFDPSQNLIKNLKSFESVRDP